VGLPRVGPEPRRERRGRAELDETATADAAAAHARQLIDSHAVQFGGLWPRRGGGSGGAGGGASTAASWRAGCRTALSNVGVLGTVWFFGGGASGVAAAIAPMLGRGCSATGEDHTETGARASGGGASGAVGRAATPARSCWGAVGSGQVAVGILGGGG
jgi:hypothetical protein